MDVFRGHLIGSLRSLSWLAIRNFPFRSFYLTQSLQNCCVTNCIALGYSQALLYIILFKSAMMTPDTRSIPLQLNETNQRKSLEIPKYRIIYQEFYENISYHKTIIDKILYFPVSSLPRFNMKLTLTITNGSKEITLHTSSYRVSRFSQAEYWNKLGQMLTMHWRLVS